jgi:hypothetical protein
MSNALYLMAAANPILRSRLRMCAVQGSMRPVSNRCDDIHPVATVGRFDLKIVQKNNSIQITRAWPGLMHIKIGLTTLRPAELSGRCWGLWKMMTLSCTIDTAA